MFAMSNLQLRMHPKPKNNRRFLNSLFPTHLFVYFTLYLSVFLNSNGSKH